MSYLPWYQEGLRFECQRTGNCCKTHGEYAFIYVAKADVSAMSAVLNISEAEFLEKYCAEDNGYTIVRMDEPACPFLTEENACGVYQARPKQCATWPFWKENMSSSQRWNGPVKDCCAGIGKGPLHTRETMERIARETEEWYEKD
jgi:Fe-S-cluster containining protein